MRISLPQDGYAIHHQIERADDSPLECMVNIGSPLVDLVAHVAKETAIIAVYAPSTTTHTYTIVRVAAGEIVERGEGVTVVGGRVAA